MAEYILEEQTGCIGTWSQDAYDLQVKEGVFETSLWEILVIHKKNIKSIRPQEIGDGMKVIVTKEPYNDVDLDAASVVSWMTIYEWFDEHSGSTMFYAYGFDKNKIERANALCTQLELPISLHPEKFVRLEATQNGDYTSIHPLSYIFGLVLVYGSFDIQGECIQHAKIHLPLEWSIASYEERMLSTIQSLHAQWLYITYDYQDQKNWQMLQINIDDREILDIWSWWMWWEEYDMGEYIAKIDDFVWHTDFTTDKVLKFLHK